MKAVAISASLACVIVGGMLLTTQAVAKSSSDAMTNPKSVSTVARSPSVSQMIFAQTNCRMRRTGTCR